MSWYQDLSNVQKAPRRKRPDWKHCNSVPSAAYAMSNWPLPPGEKYSAQISSKNFVIDLERFQVEIGVKSAKETWRRIEDMFVFGNSRGSDDPENTSCWSGVLIAFDDTRTKVTSDTPHGHLVLVSSHFVLKVKHPCWRRHGVFIAFDDTLKSHQWYTVRSPRSCLFSLRAESETSLLKKRSLWAKELSCLLNDEPKPLSWRGHTSSGLNRTQTKSSHHWQYPGPCQNWLFLRPDTIIERAMRIIPKRFPSGRCDQKKRIDEIGKRYREFVLRK